MKNPAKRLTLASLVFLNTCNPAKEPQSPNYNESINIEKSTLYLNSCNKKPKKSPKYDIMEVMEKGDTIWYKTQKEICKSHLNEDEKIKVEKIRIKNEKKDTTILEGRIKNYHEGHLNRTFDL